MSRTARPPRDRRAPRDEAQLAALITGRDRALAVGSKTSKSACFVADDLELRLDHFRHLEVDPTARVVRVGAGVTLRALLDALNARGLALPTIGEWAGQTIAGAISTGTHGGSYVYGSVVTSVRAVTTMDGLGSVREVRRGEPDFEHLIPSFGTTGVVLAYELACEPRFDVRLRRRTVPFEAYLDRLLALADAESPPTYKASIWLPALDHVVDYEGTRAAPGEPRDGLRRGRESRFNTPALTVDFLGRQLARDGRDFRGRTLRGRGAVALSKVAARALAPRDYLGPYDAMIAPLSGDAAAILKKRARNRTPPEGEFALGRDAARPFIERLRALFAERGWYPERPVGLRPGAAEGGSLSASQGAPCVWVSLFIRPDNPLMGVLPEMLMEFGARPHWGKRVFHPVERVHALYPAWQAFAQRRDALDPERVFVNDFARRLGL